MFFILTPWFYFHSGGKARLKRMKVKVGCCNGVFVVSCLVHFCLLYKINHSMI